MYLLSYYYQRYYRTGLNDSLCTKTGQHTHFYLTRMAEKLQVLLVILGLVIIVELFHVIHDVINSRRRGGAEYPFQLLVKSVLYLGVPSGFRFQKKESRQQLPHHKIWEKHRLDCDGTKTHIHPLNTHLLFWRKYFFRRLILVWHCSTVLM